MVNKVESADELRLVINFSMLGLKPTGLGIYAANCAPIFDRFRADVLTSSPADYPNANAVIVSPGSVTIGGGKVAAIKRLFWALRLKIEGKPIIFSPTHHGLPRRINQIITIHDLICFRFPFQHIPQYLYFKYLVPHLLKRCIGVFTVSETTRIDVAKSYGYPLERIWVVPNAVDSGRFVPGQVDNERPFLLMVGARYSHKNVEEVLKMSDLWQDDYRLVVTSCGGSYRRRLENLVAKTGLGHRVEFLDYVDEAALIKLYQRCAALVYPSKWEGFGIPPLEALACGRPVIVSDIAVHREVLADSGIFVTLEDRNSWAAALSALKDEEVKKVKLAIGRSRVDLYTSNNAALALERGFLAAVPSLRTLVR